MKEAKKLPSKIATKEMIEFFHKLSLKLSPEC
jgi:hypothetical protein